MFCSLLDRDIATATLAVDKCHSQAALSTWWYRAMAGLAGVVAQPAAVWS